MKKKLAFILALAAMASTSATAFAETNTGNAPTSIDVNGKYVAGDARSVISVDVTWDNMDFTYTAPSKGDWNAKTHEYENSVEGSWSADNGTDPKITVSNHSNIPIKTNLDFVSDVEGVSGSFSKNNFTLDSAVGTEYDQAPKDSTAFSVSGNGIDKDEKLGTITVTVGSAITEISTADQLLATANQDGEYKLANNIDLGDSTLNITSSNYVLDLNGFTVSGSTYYNMIIIKRGKVTIKNGTIHNTNDNSNAVIEEYSSELVLEDCAINGYNNSLFTDNGKVHVKNCNFKLREQDYYNILNAYNCELTLSGNVFLLDGAGLSNQAGGTAKVLAGTYNFDPTAYVDTDTFTVTKSGENWVVAKK